MQTVEVRMHRRVAGLTARHKQLTIDATTALQLASRFLKELFPMAY